MATMEVREDNMQFDGINISLSHFVVACPGIYLYHVRKAAGTTVREILAHITKKWHVKLFETEGLTLDHR